MAPVSKKGKVKKDLDKLSDENDYVVIDRFYLRGTRNRKSFMSYRLHRIDTPDCCADNDYRSGDISLGLYNGYWDRQFHASNPLQHSLPERHMLKLFTELTGQRVDIVDFHKVDMNDTKLFVITIRLTVPIHSLADRLQAQIDNNMNAGKIIKMVDARLGVNYKKDISLVTTLDDSDEDVPSPLPSVDRSTRSPTDPTAVDEEEPSNDTNLMYGRIERPASRIERNLYRLAAIALECSKSSLNRITRAKVVGVFDKSGKGILDDEKRLNQKIGAPELTIVCDYKSYVPEMNKLMSEWRWENFKACMKSGVVAVEIENKTRDLVPPMNAVHPITKRGRRYIDTIEHAPDVRLVDTQPRTGCKCGVTGDCVDGCPCRGWKDDGKGTHFECISLCNCTHEKCQNRKITKCARRVRLRIVRSLHIGWTVITLDDIVKDQPIGYYAAELKRSTEEIDENEHKRIGPLGHTQLFEIPSERKYGGKALFVLDSYDAGNVMTFIQHSCAPNCEVRELWTDSRDINCSFLTFFALCDIPKGTPLSFDYKAAWMNGNESRAEATSHIDEERYPLEKCRCGAPNCSGTFQEKGANLYFAQYED